MIMKICIDCGAVPRSRSKSVKRCGKCRTLFFKKFPTRLGSKASEESRKKMSLAHLGHKHTEETKKKISAHHRRFQTMEARIKTGLARRGEKSNFWKGGVTETNKLIRQSWEYRLWREAVFKRDNFTCQFCFQRGGELTADHIKPFSLFPELRFAIDNGRTLCRPCHKTTDTWGGKMKSYTSDDLLVSLKKP